MITEKQAMEFAEYAHSSINQLRKYTNEPYIVHPRDVVSILKTVPYSFNMVAAAWLHDTIEDVPWVTRELLEIVFGHDIAYLVYQVTDVSTHADGNRAVRKAMDKEKLSKVTPEGQTIKLADLISNTSSIVQYDPGFAVKYMKEKQELLFVLTKGDKTLHDRATALVNDYYRNR